MPILRIVFVLNVNSAVLYLEMIQRIVPCVIWKTAGIYKEVNAEVIMELK
jgi:hypothetical protein